MLATMTGRRVVPAERRRAAPSAPERAAGTWAIDTQRSVARFSMKYMLIGTLCGTLGPIEGAIVIDEGSPDQSSVTASIDVTKLKTGIGLRDRHLRSDDFFGVDRFPTVAFCGLRVGPLDAANRFRIAGKLTIRDVTREVTLDTVFEGETASPDGSRRATFTATTQLSRQAFGLARRVKKSGIASDGVAVTLEISAVSSG